MLTASAVAGRPEIFGRETFDGETFDGETFEGETFDGETFDGETFEGETFEGETFDGETFDGEVLDGAGRLLSARAGLSGLEPADEPADEAADEPTKDARTASRASFWGSSSRGSWRIASSLILQPSEVHGDTMPAARSSIVSADTLRASARDEMTEIEGRASPCSIWLR